MLSIFFALSTPSAKKNISTPMTIDNPTETSMLTAVGLSAFISVLMFYLALAVLKAKKIDNTEEEKPAF